MATTLILAALAGGAALFVWGFVSWVALPWHHATYRGFADEDAVVRAIDANAPSSGIYMLPKPVCGATMSPEEKKAARERATAKMKTGTTVQAIVVRGGWTGMGGFLVRGFLFGVLAAGLAAFLLEKTAIVSLVGRAAFVTLVAGVGGFAVHSSNWNWHRYPTRHTLVNLLDVAIGWFLAGLAIAAILPGA
jgi:hypothetical protein